MGLASEARTETIPLEVAKLAVRLASRGADAMQTAVYLITVIRCARLLRFPGAAVPPSIAGQCSHDGPGPVGQAGQIRAAPCPACRCNKGRAAPEWRSGRE